MPNVTQNGGSFQFGGDIFGDVTSVANEVRQILWPDGDDTICAIDAIYIWGVLQARSL